jgi:hypothetical protein
MALCAIDEAASIGAAVARDVEELSTGLGISLIVAGRSQHPLDGRL